MTLGKSCQLYSPWLAKETVNFDRFRKNNVYLGEEDPIIIGIDCQSFSARQAN